MSESSIKRQPTSHPTPTLRYGDRLGDYLINGFAGTGATSFVYRARHESSFESVAIKVLHPHLLEDEVKRRRFLREAHMMMAMRHPNIVRFHEILELGDQLAFVMEYIEGRTLETWQKKYAAMADEETLTCLFMDILRGVGNAHRHGIVHRDLKPANVMITQAEDRLVAKIIDFGVARFADRPVEPEDKAKIVGTAAYISPEEVRNPELVGPSSDLYSIGVMMYETACGRRPFEGMPIKELMRAHSEIEPESPREVRPELTPHLERVILRTLSKTPDARFKDARELMVALERAMAGMEDLGVLEEGPTKEWGRVEDVLPSDPEEKRKALEFLLWIRHSMFFVMAFMMSSGYRGDSQDPHHLNRGGVEYFH